MSMNIEEIRETLSINREDIKGNRGLTNEYIVEDLMMELGYNKRKNKAVKETPEDTLTWRVYEGEDLSEAKLAVKVFGLSEEINSDELSKALDTACSEGFKVIVVTDGVSIGIYRAKNNGGASKVLAINIEDDLDDAQLNILEAISAEGFDLSVIDSQLNVSSLTDEEIIDLAISNVDKLAEVVSTVANITDDEVKEHIQKVLHNKLSKLEGEANNSDMDEDRVKEIMRDFRKQIEDLSKQLADSQDELQNVKLELKAKIDEIENISGAEEKKAKELIDAITGSPDADRSYVAVINKEVIQFSDINTFIGRALQKLYEIKHYEASQYIFNTDALKLVSPATRGDLLMNNKTYDIELDSDDEDIALNKLRILFSHFSDIIFECKKLGTLKGKTKNTVEEADSNTDEKENTAEEEVSNSDNNDLNIESIVEDTANELFQSPLNIEIPENIEEIEEETTDDTDIDADTFFDNDNGEDEIDFGEAEIDFGEEQQNTKEVEADIEDEAVENNTEDAVIENNDDSSAGEEQQGVMKPVLICSQLPQLSMILWSEENIEFNNIKYIGSSRLNLNINSKNEEMTCEQILCKCINAVIALAEINGDSSVVQRLRTTDLSSVSNFIKLYTTEYINCTKINCTRYVVEGLKDIKQVASALTDIAEALNIDTSDMFIFLDAETTSNDIIEDWGYEEASIQLRDYNDFKEEETDNEIKTVSILKGNIFSNIMITKNSLKAYKNIIGKTIAVKTEYIKSQIRPDNKKEDFAEIIKAIICESLANTGETSIPVENIGNVMGESYKLVSTDESKVGPEHMQLNANGLIIYVSMVDDWQIPLSIIKAHTTMMNDSNIIVKVQINSKALDFYTNEFEASEPEYMLAVKGFVNYVKSCIKEQ